MKKYLSKLLILLLVFSFAVPTSVFALDEKTDAIYSTEDKEEDIYTTGEYKETGEITYTNEETGYKLIIADQADLLTPEEEIKLKDTMTGITKYGHVGFVTINANPYGTAESFARNYSHETFGNYVSSTVFVIDMYTRYIYLFNNGDIEKKISANKSEVITDNTFRYASRKEYYDCANETFKQVYTLLEGGKISEPMRHISNVLMAIALSVLLGYLIVSGSTKVKKQIELKNYASTFALANANATFIGDHKVYCPPSDSGGGGSSGGGGGGGGGGGSGGGHGF
jgi:uncharacterized protein